MEERSSYINISKKTTYANQNKYKNPYERKQEEKAPTYESKSEAKLDYDNEELEKLAETQANLGKRSKPKVFGSLRDMITITGSDGKEYRLYPLLTPEQAKSVRVKTGRILRSEEERISGFLGAGAFSEVYVAEDIASHEWLAIKVISDRLEESEQEAKLQQALTQALKSQESHIMPLFDAVKKEYCLYYIMPLLALGDISELQTQLPTLKDAELKRLLNLHIAQGLLLALWQMHHQGIYHLDVKLANLLAKLDGSIAISDFGCSERVEKKDNQALITAREDKTSGRNIANGDPNYFAPERREAERRNKPFDCIKSDIYSAGLALWELFTGMNVKDYRKQNRGQSFLEHSAIQSASPHSLGDLIKHLIDPNPETRWNLAQALNHPIFQAPDIHNKESLAVVLDFLRRFVEQLQREDQDLNLNQLVQSQLRESVSINNNNDDQTEAFIQQLQQSLANKSGLPEQLKLHLPLKGSLSRDGSNPFALVEAVYQWLEGNKAVLALLAEGGSGKSLSVQKLVLQLLNNLKNVKPGEKPWVNGQERIVIGFGYQVGHFQLQTNYTLSLLWLGTNGNKLLLTETDITNALNLSQNNADLFKQRGAIGEPVSIELLEEEKISEEIEEIEEKEEKEKIQTSMQTQPQKKTNNLFKIAINYFQKRGGIFTRAEGNLSNDNNQQPPTQNRSRFSKLPNPNNSQQE